MTLRLKCKPLPSRAKLRAAFDYDPETGRLRWRIHRGAAAAGAIAGGNDKDGRRVVTLDSEDYFASRLIWKWVTGREPRGVIDHRDRDCTNDRFYNLRDITLSLNAANKAVHISKVSGYRGVSFHKRPKKWRASIQVDGKRTYLGFFATIEEARRVYVAASAIYHPRNWRNQ